MTEAQLGGLVYSSTPWKIYQIDAGMGERDYIVMLNDVFFCKTEHSQTAHEIIRAIRMDHSSVKSDAVLDALEKIIETESWFALKAFVRELRQQHKER